MKICKTTAELRSYKHWSPKTSFTTNLSLIFPANITITKIFFRINECCLFKSLKEINYSGTAIFHGIITKSGEISNIFFQIILFSVIVSGLLPPFLCLFTAVILRELISKNPFKTLLHIKAV